MEGSLATFKANIQDTLSQTDGPATFAYASSLTQYCNPGLSVNGIGAIGLPLTKHDAEAIVSQAQQSSFGFKDTTIVDPSVRKSWELNPSQFSIRNTSWQTQMQTILSQICQGLNLKCDLSDLSAELNKLLLYETGAFFKPHKDSEKVPGMFGTLVVCLPSSHEGGQLLLNHNGAIFSHETQPTSEFDVSFAAWYSNITHEVKPVISGYRLVLTYNLVRRATSMPIAPPSKLASLQESQLRTALMSYEMLLDSGDNYFPEFLVYKLEHKYTQTSLSSDRLTAQDRDRVQLLLSAARTCNFDLYLGTLEKSIEADEEGLTDDAEEIDEQIKHIVDLSGGRVCSDMSLPEDSVIGEERDLDDFDHVEEQGWTGNEGVPATYWYRDTVILIVPRRRRIDFLVNCGHAEEKLIELLISLKNSIATDQDALRDIMRLCQLSVTSNSTAYVYSPRGRKTRLIVEILRVLLDLQQYDMFDNARRCAMTDEILQCADQLALSIVGCGFRAHKPRMHDIVATISNTAIANELLAEIRKNLLTSLEDPKSETFIEFEDWRCQKLLDCWERERPLTVQEGETISAVYGNLQDESLRLRIISLITKDAMFAARVGFCNAFVRVDDQFSSKAQKVRVCQHFQQIWEDFELSRLARIPLTEHPVSSIYASQFSNPRPPTRIPENTITLEELVCLINNSIKHGSSCTVENICESLAFAAKKATDTAQTEALVDILRKVLDGAIPAFFTYQVPVPACQRLFQGALGVFISITVGFRPARRNDWVRSGRRCYKNCDDCHNVNRFLADGTRSQFSVAIAKPGRKHLDSVFEGITDPSKSYDITTITGRTPYSWCITKNEDYYYNSIRVWEQNLKHAQNTLKSLDRYGPSLKDFLGSHYDFIMSGLAEQVQDLVTMPLSEAQPRVMSELSDNQTLKRGRHDDDAENFENKRARSSTIEPGSEVIDLT